jgi:hypothetical protein
MNPTVNLIADPPVNPPVNLPVNPPVNPPVSPAVGPMVNSTVLRLGKRLLAGLPIGLVTLLAFANNARAETFRTQHFQVTITPACAEGNVTCRDITYQGKNLTTGATITLKGRTVHSLCADGVTPCAFQGYEFRHGEYRYFVGPSQTLTVLKGGRVILQEAALADQADRLR